MKILSIWEKTRPCPYCGNPMVLGPMADCCSVCDYVYYRF